MTRSSGLFNNCIAVSWCPRRVRLCGFCVGSPVKICISFDPKRDHIPSVGSVALNTALTFVGERGVRVVDFGEGAVRRIRLGVRGSISTSGTGRGSARTTIVSPISSSSSSSIIEIRRFERVDRVEREGDWTTFFICCQNAMAVREEAGKERTNNIERPRAFTENHSHCC